MQEFPRQQQVQAFPRLGPHSQGEGGRQGGREGRGREGGGREGGREGEVGREVGWEREVREREDELKG